MRSIAVYSDRFMHAEDGREQQHRPPLRPGHPPQRRPGDRQQDGRGHHCRTATTPAGPMAPNACAPSAAPDLVAERAGQHREHAHDRAGARGGRPRLPSPWPSISTGRPAREMPTSRRGDTLWRMDPEVRQLRALLAVVDAGTFTGAAAVSGVRRPRCPGPWPRWSGRWARACCGGRPASSSLTPVGARSSRHARRVLEEVAAIRRAAAERPATSASATPGRRSAGTPPPVQRRWSRAHPRLVAGLRPVQHARPPA